MPQLDDDCIDNNIKYSTITIGAVDADDDIVIVYVPAKHGKQPSDRTTIHVPPASANSFDTIVSVAVVFPKEMIIPDIVDTVEISTVSKKTIIFVKKCVSVSAFLIVNDDTKRKIRYFCNTKCSFCKNSFKYSTYLLSTYLNYSTKGLNIHIGVNKYFFETFPNVLKGVFPGQCNYQNMRLELQNSLNIKH